MKDPDGTRQHRFSAQQEELLRNIAVHADTASARDYYGTIF